MKRDMDLVRQILIAMENFHPPDLAVPLIEGYDTDTVGFHVHLMAEAGLVKAISLRSKSRRHSFAAPTELTWEGYDALDAVRNDTIWAQAKAQAAKAGGVTIQLLVEVAKAIIRQNLGALAGGPL